MRFVQPDPRTCGAAVLVRLRMLTDDAYDGWLRGTPDPAATFADEALRTHRRTNRTGHASGRLTVPWPRALGTQPWALARELPRRHAVRLVTDRARAWDAITGAAGPVPVYVGNRLLPRHVVLVVGRAGETRLRVYEPAAGSTVEVTRDAFTRGDLRLAGWSRPWFVVVPG